MDLRIVVRAADTADVITSAGGWICDHVMAGWAVEVWLPEAAADGTDLRPLAILGARVHLSAEDARPAAIGRPQLVQHRLSAAARAFKTHALAASGLDCESAGLEAFWLMESTAGQVRMLVLQAVSELQMT